jgi:hypothetical protein
MNVRKFWAMAGIAVVMVALAALGGGWSRTYAGYTVATVAPPAEKTALPGDLAGRFQDVECYYDTLSGKNDSDLYILRYPQTQSTTRWGGVIAPAAAACQPAIEMVCGAPVRYVPQRGQLNFYRAAIELRQYVQGSIDSSAACGSMQVYFDLTAYERYMHDTFPERFGLYAYNADQRAWEPCADVSFDQDAGEHGRISCTTTQWGFFALGWPAAQ